jgi:hypothetical protein
MISLAIAAVAHQITVIILPDLKPIFSPFTMGRLIVVLFGIVAGFKVAQFGGKYMHVMLAGILLSLVPWIAKTTLNRGIMITTLTYPFNIGEYQGAVFNEVSIPQVVSQST